ncbi:MAG: hypothetical protein MI749_12865, partial [Desulfovibrionales bacterium]|nr:hypothetical protein [Desulfovibrionales bacterium]
MDCLGNETLYPYTTVTEHLPDSIRKILPRIINYRFGTLPDSNMLTTEVRGYVEPGKAYSFHAGGFSQARSNQPVAQVAKSSEIPEHASIHGRWTSQLSHAREEANVLGQFGTLQTDCAFINIPRVTATREALGYYNSILVGENEAIEINAPFLLPVNVVTFDRNYEQGYLSLPDYGGGYYLETHNTPHLWSHLDKKGDGVVILGKNVADGHYHLTAFSIPYGKAIYAPGGVIHCDGLLTGRVMAIYTVTEDYSSVIIKGPDKIVTKLQIRDGQKPVKLSLN